MLKKIILFITIFCTSLQSYGMELTKHTNNDDVFSQQPNKIRKLILFPLINRCTSYKEARDVLFSTALVSKKSYEQTNCLSFITEVITLLAKKGRHSTEMVALHLGTPGALKYRNLGNSLYQLCMIQSHPSSQIKQIRNLLNQGADINFQTANFNTTPLMKATAKSNPLLVVYLIKRGAHINKKSNNKYIREYSVLYEKEELEHYFYLLAEFMKEEQNKNTPRHLINNKLYKSSLGTIVRNALTIDCYLEMKGCSIHRYNQHKIDTNLKALCKKIPLAPSIHHIITNEEHADPRTN